MQRRPFGESREPRAQSGGRDPRSTTEHKRPNKPALVLQPTTLWDYPSQHYGSGMQGNARYVGATPSYVIWNVISRYTNPGDLVVDPMCGSGTTFDVAKDLGRTARGFDLHAHHPQTEIADARKLPLKNGEAKLVFLDPPYGHHIAYSEDEKCIGKLSAYSPEYYREMARVIREANRVLAKDGVFALYCCDYFEKKRGLACVGFELFAAAAEHFRPLDIVTVTRHHKTLAQGNYRRAAEEGNFFLRGFNYLFLLQKK